MTDREKVVKGLRHCLHYNGSCLDCPYDGSNCQNDVLDDAVALLKEQEAIIRCNDCIWYNQRDGQCEHHVCINNTSPDWFCADGERRVKE